ncbi:hypothetical protein [Zavarzinella formosa]|uniref:hypothetical protein n=1 Tax=Zavarzinella formosa TaxID=360055 RepID=UPI0002FBABA2|nr:hypothetical protein [Zavarzinella formosa]
MTVIAWEVGDKEFSVIPRIAHIYVKEDEGKFCGRGEGSGGSGPCGSQNASQPAKSSASVALTTAPLVWGLLTAGLEIGRSFLNGPLALNFRDGTEGFCVWDNGGDGEQTPHVELRCESPMVTAWRLTIRRGSEAPVEYVRPATEWNPLTPNVIYRAAKADTAAPEQLTLIPG